MTAPDVTALAAALDDHRHPGTMDGLLRVRRDHIAPYVDGFNCAEAIIAALAAQGWRITSAPEPARGSLERQGATADDPVSAQAAPDLDTAKLKGRWEAWLAEKRRIEQAAVRAALEGLRAEVLLLKRAWEDDPDFLLTRQTIIAIIDARLADLP